MSTRMTIDYGPGYHLYAEVLDTEHAYLLVEGGAWVESFGSEFYRSRHPETNEPPEMVLRIPAEVAEELFDGWDGTPYEKGYKEGVLGAVNLLNDEADRLDSLGTYSEDADYVRNLAEQIKALVE